MLLTWSVDTSYTVVWLTEAELLDVVPLAKAAGGTLPADWHASKACRSFSSFPVLSSQVWLITPILVFLQRSDQVDVPQPLQKGNLLHIE